jgi:hypothetical protein
LPAYLDLADYLASGAEPPASGREQRVAYLALLEGEKPAAVVPQQRLDADRDLPAQVALDRLVAQRQVGLRGLAPQAKNLLGIWPALSTFTTTRGVEPTNNAAERGLRGAVIYRKLSLGSQSHTGERMIERLLSISQTCRLQHRSMFASTSAVLNGWQPVATVCRYFKPFLRLSASRTFAPV